MADYVTRTIKDTGQRGEVWRPGADAGGAGRDGRVGTAARGARRRRRCVLAVALGIVASGAYDAIKAGVAQFRERFPRAEVVIEDDDAAPDDGGFLADR